MNKHRPVFVTRTRPYTSTITIIPLSSKRYHDDKPSHIDINKFHTVAVIESMTTIDKQRLTKPMRDHGRIASITQTEWEQIDNQIRKNFLLTKLK